MGNARERAVIDLIDYRPINFYRANKNNQSIKVLGIDTEAYTTGKCFMIATSMGDVYNPYDWPGFLFTRKYRGSNFVAYNLKYDGGAFLQHFDSEHLKILQTKGKVKYDGYQYTSISNKLLSIRKGKNTIHIYDLLNFYNMSLDAASKKFLNKSKLDIETKRFTRGYVDQHWDKIAKYCVEDAVLCYELAQVLIKKFEQFGVYPRKLYSVAYVSYQYFSTKCPYINVKRYWDTHKPVLSYAMQSYNGGKFEVTQKGPGYYYEYDIISAYPYEIANLVDIRDARIEQSKKFKAHALYGFMDCSIKIPVDVFSPVAVKRGTVNIYPVGEYRKVITKTEYEYLISKGCDLTINNAYYLLKSGRMKPYHKEILRLMKWKDEFKRQHSDMDYHTIKIFLNSFYGKMVQLIEKDGRFKAGSSWNPIYGSIITANCRVRISELQNRYPSVVAVHTDSIISTKPLPFKKNGKLGDLVYELEGDGVILGSGIYQIGNKSKFRGFDTKNPLIDMIPSKGKKLRVSKLRPYTWREVAHRNLELNRINRFEEIPRELNLNFDTKRIWLEDYKSYNEVLKSNVISVPWLMGLF